MRKLLCALLVLLLIPSLVLAAAVTEHDAVSAALGRVENVGAYSREHPDAPGSVPAWTSGAAVRSDPTLVHSYPALRPLYYYVALETDPPTFVTVDAQTGAWHAHGAVPQRGYPLVSRSRAAEIFARELDRPCPEATVRAVSLPDKHLYWYHEGSRDGEARELFLNLVGPDDLRFEPPRTTPGDAPPPGRLRSGSAGGGVQEGEGQSRGGRYPTSYDIVGVPHYTQETSYHCGPAALEMLFDYWGPHVDQTDIGFVAGTELPDGTYTSECRRASHFSWVSTAVQDETLHGYDERALGYSGVEDHWDFEHYANRYDDLKELVSSDDPVFILTWFDESHGTGHFRIVKGYDDNTDVFIVHDPWYSGPYGGPDTHFNQAFLVDDLWVYSGRWGLFAAPWEVTVAAPSEVDEGEEFTVSATATYRAPHPFDGEWPAETPQMSLSLPLGFELAPGETADRFFPGPWSAGDGPFGASWQVVAVEAPVPLTLVVEARGYVTGSSLYYDSYSDWIGGTGEATVTINMQTPIHIVQVDAAGGGHFLSIQEGLDACADGDTVVVAPGSYVGPLNRDLNFSGKELVLVSENGASETVIDAGGAGRGFVFLSGEGPGTVVDGFTITNGTPETGFGGAISCTGASSPTIRKCSLVANSSGFLGGGVYCDEGSAPSLSYVVFHGNASAMGSGLYCKNGSDAVVSHCTFVENTGAQLTCVDSSPTVSTSIFAFGLNSGSIACNGSSVPTITHCAVFGNAGGDSLCGDYSENLFDDPLFCDLATGDLTLHDNSPCLPGNNAWLEAIGALGAGGCGVSSGIPHGDGGSLTMGTPTPNPFRGVATIEFAVPGPGGNASLIIYNAKGQRVRTLLEGPVAGGTQLVTWNGRDQGGRRMASGVYFCTLTLGSETTSRKMILLR